MGKYVSMGKVYSDSANFQHRWSLSETIKFLGLLKKYPILVQKCTSGSGVIENRRVAFESLLEDCLEADMGVRDMKALRSKIDTMKYSFSAALTAYQEKVQRKVRNPKSSLRWFHYAHFLDTTGYLRKLKEKRPLNSKNLPKARPSTAARSTRPFPLPRNVVPPTNHRPAHVTRSTNQENGTSSSLSHGRIKIEVHDGYDDHHLNGEEPGGGESSTGAEEEEDSEAQEGANNSAGHRVVQSASASRDTSSGTVQRAPPPEAVVVPQPRQQDYFSAFFEYAKTRSADYSGRQKREIIIALTNAMSRIDEENESRVNQNYSIQMYSSFDEFNNRHAKE